MIRKQYPSQEEVKRRLDYDKETGIFTWKERPLSDFRDDINPSMSHITWNAKHKGKPAGSTSGNYVRIEIGKGCPFAAHKLAWIYVYGDGYQGDIDHKNRKKKIIGLTTCDQRHLPKTRIIANYSVRTHRA